MTFPIALPHRMDFLARLRLGLMSMIELVTGCPVAKLPRRVVEEIRRQQAESERMIGWTQAAGTFVFLAAWALAPEEATARNYWNPAPYVLTIYLVLVAGRLVLGRCRPLPPAVIGLSIVLDVVVLMALIVCLPLAWNAPLALALKHTAYAFLFVIVALRALRFEPVWVLLAGGTAVLAWVLLGLGALAADGQAVLTSDARRYFVEPVLLPAAEIDRVLALAAFTLVLALVVTRGQELVRRSAAGAAAAGELSRYFARNLAQRITQSATELMPGNAERREATIVFFDMRGFSGLAHDQSGEVLLRLLADYHALIIPIVRRHGGSVDKFLGDGVLVSFGAIDVSTTHARDAMNALSEAIAAGHEWTAHRMRSNLPTAAINGAAASGEVLAGTIGHGDRLEFTVIGDAVNVAAKLEKHMKREGVTALATAGTYVLASAQGFDRKLKILPGREVAGIADPLDLAVVCDAPLASLNEDFSDHP